MTTKCKTSWNDLILVIMAFCQPILVIFQAFLILWGMSEEQSSTYRAVLSAVPVIISLPILLRRKPRLFFVSFLLIGILLFTQWMIFSNNRELIEYNAFRFIFPIMIPCFLAIPCMKSPIETIDKGLMIVSWVITIEGICYFLNFMRSGLMGETYDMGTCFAILLPALYFITKSKLFYYGISALLAFVILLMGSRSPFLVILIFSAYFFFLEKKKSKGSFFGILLILLLMIFIKPILLLFVSAGYESRTINAFLSDNIYNAAGRDFIYPIILNKISENPLTGLGLYSDRMAYGVVSKTSYAHNFILEVWLDFGVILGSLFLFFVLIYPFIRCLRFGRHVRILFVVVATYTLIPLFSSGSYLVTPIFGTYLGFVYLLFMSSTSLVKYIKK